MAGRKGEQADYRRQSWTFQGQGMRCYVEYHLPKPRDPLPADARRALDLIFFCMLSPTQQEAAPSLPAVLFPSFHMVLSDRPPSLPREHMTSLAVSPCGSPPLYR